MTYLRNPKENSEFLNSEFRKARLIEGNRFVQKNKKKFRGTK